MTTNDDIRQSITLALQQEPITGFDFIISNMNDMQDKFFRGEILQSAYIDGLAELQRALGDLILTAKARQTEDGG